MFIDAPGQKLRRSDVTAAGVTGAQRAVLIKANVLAEHVDGTITCAARHVVKSVQLLRDASSPAPEDAAHAVVIHPVA